jgi:hypothetical protein
VAKGRGGEHRAKRRGRRGGEQQAKNNAAKGGVRGKKIKNGASTKKSRQMLAQTRIGRVYFFPVSGYKVTEI